MAKPGPLPSSQTGLKAPEKVIKLCIALLESAKSYPYFQQPSLIFTFRTRKLVINEIKIIITTCLLPCMNEINTFSPEAMNFKPEVI